ncbi:hypothetical protein BTA51_22935 [Hahella sp. CCB-MM4]|nr:hypothetical protein BTA51_22935 [Hahella sp. CCB-MM4]
MGMATCCLDADTSCAAARAGITKVSALPKLFAAPGEIEPVPLNGYQYPFLEGYSGASRLAQLAYKALKDLMKGLPKAERQPLKLFIQIPSSTVRPELLDQEIKQDKDSASLFRIALLNIIQRDPYTRMLADMDIEVLVAEPAEFVFAMKDAHEYLNQHGGARCIVGAVDSLLGEKTVELLLAREQILTPDSSTGFLPGEAAAMLLLTNQDEQGTVAGVSAVQYGNEEYDFYPSDIEVSEEGEEIEDDEENETSTFYHGREMAAVIKGALEHGGIQNDKFDVFTGFGEFPSSRDRALEWGNILVNLKQHFSNIDLIQWHLCEDSFGGIGVAFMPVSICLGLHAVRRKYLKGRHFIVSATSDTGGRAALMCSA